MSIEIKGLEDILKKLNDLPDKLENKIIRSSLRKGANVIRDEARLFAPVGSGDLKKSIVVSGKRGKKGSIAFKIRPVAKKNGVTKFYGLSNEFGTSKMAAHPFMRPAFDKVGQEVLEKTIDAIKSKVEEATK